MRICRIIFLACLAIAALSSCASLPVGTEAPERQAGAHGSSGSRSACAGAPERSPSGIEAFIDNVRNLDLPHWLSNKITYLESPLGTALHDPRSRLADLSQLDEYTVVAAELAYDVEESVDDNLQSHGRLSQRELPG